MMKKDKTKISHVVSLSRKVGRDLRRQQLIDATIRVLARRGYAQTTLTDVAVEACVSHGLVNFHFQSKEKLMTETLLFMAEEYSQNWMQALVMAGNSPAEQLKAMMAADFAIKICTPDKLACWCAYWGEAQSRPIYQEQCSANDRAYIKKLEKLCGQLIVEGAYKLDKVRAARVLRICGEGLWLDLLSMNMPYSKKEALRTWYTCAAMLFPKHFESDGNIIART